MEMTHNRVEGQNISTDAKLSGSTARQKRTRGHKTDMNQTFIRSFTQDLGEM
jgi:hypothetical protein